MIEELELTVELVAAVPPKETPVAPVNCVPVIVTVVAGDSRRRTDTGHNRIGPRRDGERVRSGDSGQFELVSPRRRHGQVKCRLPRCVGEDRGERR